MMEDLINAFESGEYARAKILAESYLKKEPKDVGVRSLYAHLLVMNESYQDALGVFDALELEGHISAVSDYVSMAVCCVECELFERAMSILKGILDEDPMNVLALRSMARATTALKQWDLSIVYLLRIIPLVDEELDLYCALASAYLNVGQYNEGLTAIKPVLEKNINDQKMIVIAGKLYLKLKNYKESILFFERLVSFGVSDKERAAYSKILSYLYNQCSDTESAFNYMKDYELLDTSFEARLHQAFFLPINYKDQEELDFFRDRQISLLTKLLKSNLNANNLLDIGCTNFPIVFQGYDERHNQSTIGGILQQNLPVYTPVRDDTDTRIRIGFFSSYFHSHSVMHFYKNLIKNLPLDFYVVICDPKPLKQDTVKDLIYDRADCVLSWDTHDLDLISSEIVSQKLDILVYPDIGMTFLSVCLAAMRLAPVQCNMMGHPLTSGLSTIDYYISADIFEHEESDSFYSEELVCVKGMPVQYDKPSVGFIDKTREQLGFSNEDHLYVCPMLPFKLMPEFDDVLVDICRKDPKAKIVLFQYCGQESICKTRIQSHFPDVYKQFQWISELSSDDFISLLAVADVVLESFPFGGGNTVLQSFAVHTPVVTCPTQFLRGRFGLGYYKLMGMMDCVANSPEEYVALSVRCATDPAFRAMVSNKLKEASPCLFGNTEGQTETMAFFRRVSGKV